MPEGCLWVGTNVPHVWGIRRHSHCVDIWCAPSEDSRRNTRDKDTAARKRDKEEGIRSAVLYNCSQIDLRRSEMYVYHMAMMENAVVSSEGI